MLALALLLVLLTGAFFFFTSDSPWIVKYRELLLGELSVSDSGEEPADTHETSDTEPAEKDSAQTADSGEKTSAIDPEALPEFAGEHYVTVDDGKPAFPNDVYKRAGYISGGKNGSVSETGTSWTISTNDIIPYEYYGELDDLGRCTVAYGCLGIETMPAEGAKRGDISQIHPSGWAKAQQWERCHLIAWALSDENANERAHIVDVAENWGITVSSYNDCAKWVWSVLQSAGFENVPHWSGARYWEHFASEEYADSSKIPVGAIVIGTGRNSDVSGTGYYYGHVGICVKNDGDEILIRDCIGPGSSGVHTQTLDEWISWQTDAYLGYDYHDPGFVGWIYYPDLERTGADFTY